MEKLLKNIRDLLLFIIFFIVFTIILTFILRKTDTDTWYEKRNRHRIYDPIEDNEDNEMNEEYFTFK